MSIRDNLGGNAGAVLDTMEEIEANTEEGKAAGALAVKKLKEMLGNILGCEIGSFNQPELSANTSKTVTVKHNLGTIPSIILFSDDCSQETTKKNGAMAKIVREKTETYFVISVRNFDSNKIEARNVNFIAFK